MLEDLISKSDLTEEEQCILCYSFGLGDYERLTLEEIAIKLPKTKEGKPVNASTVKRRLDKILDDLYKIVTEK